MLEFNSHRVSTVWGATHLLWNKHFYLGPRTRLKYGLANELNFSIELCLDMYMGGTTPIVKINWNSGSPIENWWDLKRFRLKYQLKYLLIFSIETWIEIQKIIAKKQGIIYWIHRYGGYSSDWKIDWNSRSPIEKLMEFKTIPIEIPIEKPIDIFDRNMDWNSKNHC